MTKVVINLGYQNLRIDVLRILLINLYQIHHRGKESSQSFER